MDHQHLVGGRDGEVEAGRLPATEVSEEPADPVVVKRRVQELAEVVVVLRLTLPDCLLSSG